MAASSGFPSEKLGRIRIAFAPSDPRRVYALVDADAKEGSLAGGENDYIAPDPKGPSVVWGGRVGSRSYDLRRRGFFARRESRSRT